LSADCPQKLGPRLDKTLGYAVKVVIVQVPVDALSCTAANDLAKTIDQ
jgi:hypothetical protein